ncbi:MAG: M23 family metallopeptidase [Candidatus Sericytochromatia bacterium]|nr:M23 family metallopeptidase [Candidatus Sericytochromatia bacterium]
MSTPKGDKAPLLRPMPGVVTRGVQPGHPALDIACFEGTPVRAAHDGQGRSYRSHTHGNVFALRAADGLETSYAHLQSARGAGAYRRGDVIGACGNTGSWTTGPHLHFESNQPERLLNLAEE